MYSKFIQFNAMPTYDWLDFQSWNRACLSRPTFGQSKHFPILMDIRPFLLQRSVSNFDGDCSVRFCYILYVHTYWHIYLVMYLVCVFTRLLNLEFVPKSVQEENSSERGKQIPTSQLDTSVSEWVNERSRHFCCCTFRRTDDTCVTIAQCGRFFIFNAQKVEHIHISIK